MCLLTGDIKPPKTKIIYDNSSLLSQEQIKLLYKCLTQPFQFGGYGCLYDLLKSLGVEVHIEPGIRTRQIPTSLDEAIDYWRNFYRCELNKCEEGLSKYERCKEIEINEEPCNEKNAILKMPLRGEYDPTNNVIILYPEEMMQEFGGQYMDELLVSTFAHEAMHAYFNRPGHDIFPYVLFVEEPLAEFGMLLYLHETHSPFYGWVYDDVKSKTTCYKYGANLMDQCLYEGTPSLTRDYLEAYRS